MDIKKIEKDIDSFLTNEGFELVDLKIGRHSGKILIQFFIEKLNGESRITLDDCEKMSEKIGAFIDVNNIIEGPYILEVSSPGIDRIIKKEKDFYRFKGNKVKVILKKPIDGARTYYGILEGFDSGTVILSGNLRFNMLDVEEVRLNPDFENIFKK